ncbi:ribosomal protein S18 acetylase RimI-like enzyme [Virgibacillus natechei]|uniref:Ribosomal protein S18 acetylase RimI-like enzyme n=1 Tax=Virgibacillus natechei TaxID=1216297 RepID=A0ABS4IM84_9BACI|nr:GNAT family N-acetyltransferase [Virgibacillus natechei]MBP1971094.1 ribosomal protein S18 acetylase RimI-like enzyme [Virgibacillus natechei]UZD12216.1 GNAT family N-acetyltransferase [Virgibacillus natechei]
MATVERARQEDASDILDLQKRAFLSEAAIYNDYEIMPLKEEITSTMASFEKNVVLKYVEDGKVVGSVRAYEENGECHVNRLMVHPDYQNRGIARILMEEIETYFTDVIYRLFTGSLSTKNIALYEKLGYKRYKTEKLDFEDTVFVFMEK